MKCGIVWNGVCQDLGTWRPNWKGKTTASSRPIVSPVRPSVKTFELQKAQCQNVRTAKSPNVKTLELQEAQMSKCQNARTARSPNVKTVELQKARTANNHFSKNPANRSHPRGVNDLPKYCENPKSDTRTFFRARNMFFAISSETDRVKFSDRSELSSGGKRPSKKLGKSEKWLALSMWTKKLPDKKIESRSDLISLVSDGPAGL